jgi:hypothetical protein
MRLRTELRLGDHVTFRDGRGEQGEIAKVNDDGTVEVVVDDFIGRRVICTVDAEAVRRRDKLRERRDG